MSLWQVVEKDSAGTDWHLVRYETRALERIETEEAALVVAREYLTNVNCNNSLTKDEKRNGFEAYMMDDKGCFLGTLDGEEWYLTYQKDITGRQAGSGVTHRKGDIINDPKHYEILDRAEVAVRIIPCS